MNKIVERIKKEFSSTPDLIIKEVNLSLFNKVYVIYIETLCNSERVNEFVLKNLTLLSGINHKNFNNVKNILPGPNTKFIKNNDEIEYYLTNGYTIIINKSSVLAIETKGDLTRAISSPTTEPSILGPQDSFVENYQTNIGLIKRRIKSKNLKIDTLQIGRITNSVCGILYMDNIAKIDLVNEIKRRLHSIDVDGMLDTTQLSNYIESENNTIFPTIKLTERPDVVATSLMEGKVVVLMDTSNYAILCPSFFTDFINPQEDRYYKNVNVNFLKILRLGCFFLSIMIPAFYIAIITYNQETVPTSLLMSFSAQRSGVPFPAFFEAFSMLAIYEILRESDIRFPSSTGSSISILGALILGEATVSAGIVSPIMIIVIALTFISSLVFSRMEMINTMRVYRFIFLIFATCYGLLGIVFALFIFLINLNSINSINEPYFAPIIPFDKPLFFKTVFRNTNKENKKRSQLLTEKNYTRERNK